MPRMIDVVYAVIDPDAEVASVFLDEESAELEAEHLSNLFDEPYRMVEAELTWTDRG